MTKKIYTKTGDDGTTGLFGGKRVPKYDITIEALGTIDEVNSLLGIVRSLQPPSEIDTILSQLQNDFFVMGCNITAQYQQSRSLPSFDESHIRFLESSIDQISSMLPPLEAFILPGGCPVGAHLHFARALCRRAERVLTLLAAKESLNPLLLKYLNRCSDLLFVLARFANEKAGKQDTEWHHSQ